VPGAVATGSGTQASSPAGPRDPCVPGGLPRETTSRKIHLPN